MSRVQDSKAGLRAYGYTGLIAIVVAEILMFLRVEPFYTYFTPIAWSGYILLADSIIYRIQGRSLMVQRRGELLFMFLVSVVFWLIFEAYNLHIKNWRYVGLPDPLWAKCLGFGWSFATILPAILLTARLLELLGFPKVSVSKVRFGPVGRGFLIVLGLLCLTCPLLVSFSVARYLIVLIWLGFVFFLEPINARRGGWSLLVGVERGDLSRLMVLFSSGLVCGLLWEFWNYWAGTKWIYAVPVPLGPKIFEMPLGGYLGFLPFAVECHVFYGFVMTFRRGGWSRQREV